MSYVSSPLTIILLGIIYLVFAYFRYKKENEYLSNGVKTIGTVVKITDITDIVNDNGGVYHHYYPVIDYYVGHTKHTFTSKVSCSRDTFEIGEKVNVLYLDNNTKSAEIEAYINYRDTSKSKLYGGLVLIVIGVIFVLLYSHVTNSI